jgi:viroplasmin and RNaseH domain-containing protein
MSLTENLTAILDDAKKISTAEDAASFLTNKSERMNNIIKSLKGNTVLKPIASSLSQMKSHMIKATKAQSIPVQKGCFAFVKAAVANIKIKMGGPTQKQLLNEIELLL